jgi:hypothetical protein
MRILTGRMEPKSNGAVLSFRMAVAQRFYLSHMFAQLAYAVLRIALVPYGFLKLAEYGV